MSRAFRVVILIVATPLIRAAGVFLIGGKLFLFRRTCRLEAEFPKRRRAHNGVDVRVGGIQLGTVKYISLPNGPRGTLTVVGATRNQHLSVLQQRGAVQGPGQGHAARGLPLAGEGVV
jgi:hypothetical protein